MERTYYDLTNPQKSIWFTEQFYKDTTVNSICGTVLLHEIVDFNLLKKAIEIFVQDNDSFRLKICFDDQGNIKQYLSDPSPFSIEIISLETDHDLMRLEDQMVSTPFSLIEHLLFCFKMFQFSDGQGGFIVTAHHLIADACTAGLLASKVISIYTSLLNKEENSIEATSYLSYIHSEKEYLTSSKFEKDKIYWNSIFETVPEIGSIPSTMQEKGNSCIASRETFSLSKEKVAQINQFCAENKISLFNFFMAVYAIYVSKIANLDDFVLGTPILNRSTFQEKNTPGMFISTVPFRFTIQNTQSFINFAKKVAFDSLGMFRHQKYPYQNILEDIRKKNPSQPNLYDILISYQNTRTNRNSVEVPYEVRWTFNHYVADSMQIHLFDMNDEGLLNIAYDYRLSKYNKEDIISLHLRIRYMIEQILQNSNISIKDLEITTLEEKNLLLKDFNATDLLYDKHKTIVQFFEEQVEKTPDAIALVFQNQTLTYSQLNEKVNSFARFLRKKGITSNVIVGVMLNRSLEMMISILAVLKAGGAYIPIDPEYPQERISYMLSNSKSPILISQQHLTDKIKQIQFEGTIIYADLFNNEIYTLETTNLEPISSPEDLSYIIYTSGSTGMPKGVMLTHQNVSNFISSMIHKIAYLHDGKPHSICSITTVSFDIFAFETLVSLCCGLKLFMTDESQQKITLKLERFLLDNQIEIIQSTPSIMNFHLENSSINGFSNLHYVMLAGEQLPKQLVDKLKQIHPNIKVYNGYGPSETTIFSTVKDVTSLDSITIGEPIHNTQIYILNKDFTLLPPKTIGEIYIAGDGVGKGYLYREDLTKERYLPNPFIKDSIMYKTGDLGLWLPNGSIECKGRADNQVKLRGLRIELGEIEECIQQFDPLANIKSAVIIKNDHQKDTLNAFISAKTTIDLSALKAYLSSKLPVYMIPSTFTFLDALPFTPNGKIDRKALQYYKIEAEIIEDTYVPPRNETEGLIVNSIKKKLNINHFGIDQNIFDYGADSLSIIHILTELFQYNLSLKVYDFYQYPTVRQLYDHLLKTNEEQKKVETAKFLSLSQTVKQFSTSCMPTLDPSCKSIFLTGATGFLGAHILANLLENSQPVPKIYCAIRKKDATSIEKRLYDRMHFYFGTKYDILLQEHVICILADINEVNLGIDASILTTLQNNIDCVIHCAANVKHYGNYSEFEKTNIQGTKNMLTFCKQAHAPLHYISTMTVSGNYLLEQKKDTATFNENTFYENQSFDDNVYSKSKLIAESIVIEAIKDGVNATIYRIGDLTGRYIDGVFQKNIEENSIYLRLKSLFEIGKIPSSILDNDLEFTPVEYAANAICKILFSTENKNRIFHIYNPNMLKVSTLVSYMKQLHYSISIVSKEEFLGIVKTLSRKEDSQSKITGIINDFTKDEDFIYNYTIPVENKITCDYLHALGFEWPELTLEYIQKLIQYMIDVNFLKLN